MFLTECKSIEELREQFRIFAKMLHPDNGGSHEEMAILNAEYQEMLPKLRNVHRKVESENRSDGSENDVMVNDDDIQYELVGSWIWASGNTYAHRESLKKAGFKWSSKSKKWYKKPQDDKTKVTRNYRGISEDEKTRRYGRVLLNGKGRAMLNG